MPRVSSSFVSAAMAAILALICTALFLRRAVRALLILPFGDEQGHIVGGRVLEAGGILFHDYIDAHGTLIYLLAQISDAFSFLPQPGAARLLMVLLMAAATLAVAATPCLNGLWERSCGVALFVGLTTSLWVVQGLCMLLYQPVAGFLLVIGAAQFTYPSWCGVSSSRAGLAAAGFAFGLIPFAAYSYIPAVALLIGSGIAALPSGQRIACMRPLASGFGAAVVLYGAWLVLHCDLVGYVAYHVILNQFYFADGKHFSLADILLSLQPRGDPAWIANSLAASLALAGWLALTVSGLKGQSRNVALHRCAADLLGLAGIAFANPRSSPSLQDSGLVLLAFAAAGIGWTRLVVKIGLAQAAWARATWVVVFALCNIAADRAAGTAISSPHGFTRAQLKHAPRVLLVQSNAGWAIRLRRAVAPNEHVLALPFNPSFYIEGGRLPISGFSNYFPWDADYARRPWFGKGRDLCAALRRDPPPVVYNNDWDMGGRYDPRIYMPCVYDILAEKYRRAGTDPAIYVRRDRTTAWDAPP